MIIPYNLSKENFFKAKKLSYRLIDKQGIEHVRIHDNIPGREESVVTYSMNSEGIFTGFNFFDKYNGSANLHKNSNFDLLIEITDEDYNRALGLCIEEMNMLTEQLKSNYLNKEKDE